MCSTLSNCRLYSWIRLTWLSKIDCSSRLMPCSRLTHAANRDLAACLACRNRSRKPVSSTRPRSVAQPIELRHPALAHRFGEQRGELGIAQQQPAAGRHAVGLVVEALGEHLGEVGDRLLAEQAAVDLGHAVGAVRSDDRQVGHPDLAGRGLLDQAHPAKPVRLAGIAILDVLEEPGVDLVDQLEVPGQEQLEEFDRPLLERLGQERVVGVGQGADRQVPGLVPVRDEHRRGGSSSARRRPWPDGCR